MSEGNHQTSRKEYYKNAQTKANLYRRIKFEISYNKKIDLKSVTSLNVRPVLVGFK